MGQANPLKLRPAEASDTAQILSFVRELADFEKLLHEVTADEALIAESLFGADPAAEVIIAEWEGEPVGFALFHGMFSTFTGQAGIYLEDLYVQPPFRGQGIGKALLVHLAQHALRTGRSRFDWSCLQWNEAALAFYRSIGARELSDWTRLRVDGDALHQLAALGDDCFTP